MKSIKGGLFIGLGLLTLLGVLHAQLSFQSAQPVQASGIEQPAQPDSVVAVTAEAKGLAQIDPANLPGFGTYWVVSSNGVSAPWPCPPPDLSQPIYNITGNIFLVDATRGQVMSASSRRAGRSGMTVTAEQVTTAVEALANSVANLVEQVLGAQVTQKLATALGMEEDSSQQQRSFAPMLASYSPTTLWLEVTSLDTTNQLATVLAHNTSETNLYQLLSNTNLLDNWWQPGEIRFGDTATNTTLFTPVDITDNPLMFFRIHQAGWAVSISASLDAVEPFGGVPGQAGLFYISGYQASGVTNNVTVYYRVSGTASNGVDYTALSGVATLTNGTGSTPIVINPIADSLLEGMETVTLTLMRTNDYLIDPNNSTATINLYDSSTTVSISAGGYDAIEPDGPPGVAATTGTFSVYRSDFRGIYTNAMKVQYMVSGTASNGVDYTRITNTVTFAAGETATNIIINPLKDNLPEGVESVTLTLLPTNSYAVDANNYAASLNIYDSSTTVSMGVSAAAAVEPNGPPGAPAVPATFSFSRYDTRGIYTNLPVRYVITGTASNGVDYTFLGGTVNFAPGITTTNIDITPLADTLAEGLETVTLTLLDNATNGYFIETNNATGTATIADSTTTVGIYNAQNTIEPGFNTNNYPGQTGYFTLTRADDNGFYTNLTVRYVISGTASNGVDYTKITNTVTFAPGETATNINIQPLLDYLIEGDETVILTLVATNGYMVAATAAAETNTIQDTVLFTTVTSITSPVGIDYHAPSNSLIVSYNYSSGSPYNFVRLYTNAPSTNLLMTNWSNVSGVSEEVKLATVKKTVNGFTNGEVYFGSDTGIGKLSANGSVSNLSWCVLTNATVVNPLLLRGSLYVDQTGTFSNQVIAVTSGADVTLGNKGVWRVDAQAHPTLITNINTKHLEGVITLTNDVAKWGPWAGKIITGDEDALDQNLNSSPVIYTIATNGAVATYYTTNMIEGGIHPEDFDMIPANQNLYACDNGNGRLIKLSANYFTNYVGDLLIADAGENVTPNQGKLFIVHWNAATTNFVTYVIPYLLEDGSYGRFEHVTFAPIELPNQ